MRAACGSAPRSPDPPHPARARRHYIPNLAKAILQGNARGTDPKINLQGIMVGNPWTDAQADNYGAAFMWWCVAASFRSSLKGRDEGVVSVARAQLIEYVRMQDPRAHLDADFRDAQEDVQHVGAQSRCIHWPANTTTDLHALFLTVSASLFCRASARSAAAPPRRRWTSRTPTPIRRHPPQTPTSAKRRLRARWMKWGTSTFIRFTQTCASRRKAAGSRATSIPPVPSTRHGHVFSCSLRCCQPLEQPPLCPSSHAARLCLQVSTFTARALVKRSGASGLRDAPATSTDDSGFPFEDVRGT